MRWFWIAATALIAISCKDSTSPNGSLPHVSVDTIKRSMLTITFDDGFQSAYLYGLPILRELGIKGTWYIITDRFDSSHMTKQEVLDLQTDGQEIGAHTINHFPLDTATDSIAYHQIRGSRSDLWSWGVVSVKTFSYPFGHYNSHTPLLAAQAGFATSRTLDWGQNDSRTNPQLLKAWAITLPLDSLQRITRQIDKSLADTTWLILCFHRIDETGNSLSVPDSLLKDVIRYAQEKKVPIVTMTQGFKILHP